MSYIFISAASWIEVKKIIVNAYVNEDMCIHTAVINSLIMMIDWLIGVLTARQHRKVNLCQLGGRKPAQSAKDGQRDTMHNTLRYTITM